jgi:hypothetical protein
MGNNNAREWVKVSELNLQQYHYVYRRDVTDNKHTLRRLIGMVGQETEIYALIAAAQEETHDTY